jgi:hypothetical protein
MIWICRDCGTEASASDVVLVMSLGWQGLDGDTGVCWPCVAKQSDRPPARTEIGRLTEQRIERSGRAVAASRLLVDRSRRAK